MLIQLLIICPLVFLAGFVDAIGGGGGLISLPAYLFAGVPTHMAIATNKLSSGLGTAVSTARFAKNGYMKWKFCVTGVLTALVGAPIGAMIALSVPEQIIKGAMLAVLPIAAFYVLKKKDMGDNEQTNTMPEGKMTAIVAVCGFAMGLYDGFYGPGTGTFLILLLTGCARMDTRTAAGTTKAINLTSNIASLVTYMLHGQVIYLVGLIAGVFCIAGHYLGAGCVTKNGQKIVRPVILAVLALLAVKIILDLF